MHLSNQTHALLRAPLDRQGPVATLGRSVWLYLLLVTLANSRGLVLRTRAALAADLDVPEETIESWVARLEHTQLIRLVSPSPYLVLSLRLWSRDDAVVAHADPERSSEPAYAPIDVPVSGGSRLQAAADMKSGDGGSGEGALLAEVRAVLGSEEASELSALIEEYPEPIVRRALRRVKTTPTRQIKKSKIALFRFLLAKFAENTHAHA